MDIESTVIWRYRQCSNDLYLQSYVVPSATERSATGASVSLECSGDADDAEGRLTMDFIRKFMRHSTT